MFNVTNRRLIQDGARCRDWTGRREDRLGGRTASRNASTELRRLLKWFPEDTETLVATQSFSVPRLSDTEASKSADVMPLADTPWSRSVPDNTG